MGPKPQSASAWDPGPRGTVDTGSPLLGATRKCLVHCLRMQQCCAESASKHQRCFIVIKYCSQACSVAAKATAFCICIFILKFWLDCPYFSSDFGGVSALPLGFTCEVLVASSSMPSANREWYLLGPYNVQSLVSFYPDLPHWHPSIARYFLNFCGVSVQTLGFTREVLVSQEACPQQTSR